MQQAWQQQTGHRLDSKRKIKKEIGRKHVTRKLLWEEYRSEHPGGYGYSQFCHHLNQLSVAHRGIKNIDLL